MVARGEVRWLQLDKPRPVVILNRSAVADRLNRLIVAPCTSTVRHLPTEVPLDESDGMPKVCVIRTDNLTLADRDALGSLISTLSAERMAAVCTAIAIALGCD